MDGDAEGYRQHFLLTNDVIYSYDNQLRLTSISANVEKILGYKPEELIGRSIHDTGVIHTDSLGKALENASHVLAGDTVFSSVYRFITKDGVNKFGEVSGVPIMRDGQVTGVISVARDITDRVMAEEEVKKYRNRLEALVKERTEELTKANERLAWEIEERKKDQGALEESERKARAIFNQTFQFVGLMTIDGALIEANTSALSFSGVVESDVIGKPFWETPWWTHSPELQKKLRGAIQKAAKGEFVRFEATHPSSDGSLHFIDFSLKPVMDEAGTVVYLIPEGRDITDRKKMEEELKDHRNNLESMVKKRTAELVQANEQLKQEIAERKRAENELLVSEEKYHIHFSLTRDVMYVLDDQCRVMSVSPSVENALGYKPDELMGRPFQQLGVLDADSLEKAVADTADLLSGKSFSTSIYRFITKSGVKLYGEVSGTQLRHNGKVTGVICLGRDITRRMKAEEELKKHRNHLEDLVRERTEELTRANENLSQEILKQKQTEDFLKERQARLDSIIRSAPIGIGIVVNRFLLEVNDRFCEMTGYTHEELIGKSSRMIYVTQKEFESVGIDKTRQLKERGIGYVETRWKKKDGSIIDILLSSTPIFPGDISAGVLFTALDITQRKQSEKALRESEEHIRAIADNLPGVVFQFRARKNGEYGLSYVSERSAEILGLDSNPHDFFERIVACMAPKDRSALVASIEEAIRSVSSWEFETELTRPSGEVMYVRGISQPKVDEDDIVFSGLLLDITERRLAEEASKESDKKYQALIETTGTGYVITDKKGTVLDANPEYVRLTGSHSLHEICGRNVSEWTADHEKKKNKEAVTKCFHEGVIRGFETEYMDSQGNITPIELNATVLKLDGKPRFISLCRDITERKHAEKAIRSVNKQLENIIEFLPDATFIIDREKRIIAWNRAMEDMTGVPKKAVIGKDHYYSTVPFYGEPRPYLMDLLDKDDDEIAAKYAFVKRKGNSVFGEIFAPALNNGKGAYVWAVASPLYDSDGNITGAIESIRDITDHKLTMEALSKSEGKFRFLTEKMNDIVWTTDMNFHITYDSPSVEKVLGFTPEERMRQKAIDMMTPESYTRTIETFSRELELEKHEGADPNRAITIELEYYHKDGTTRWIECFASAIRDNTGKPIGIHGVSRDINDRKQAEEALKESHQRIERQMLFSKAMLSAVPTPVFFKDTMGRYLGCNRAFSEMIGMTQDQIRGKTVHDIWPDELAQVYHDRDLELIQNPCLQVYEWKVRDKDKNARDVIFSKDVFRNENGDVAGIVGAFIDITDRKRAEDELKGHRDKLEEMIKERTADLIKTYEQLKHENETRKTTENLLRSREMELEQNQMSLKETNIALRVLLQNRDEDKATVEEAIMTNIKMAVFPFIEKLKNSGLREGQNAYLSEIELHLREIASTYIKKLSSDHISLSPCEIQVASLIKEGKSSKDIAELLNVSLNTVLTHRFCIRKKTGLKGKKVNLVSYLQTLT